MDLRAGVRAAAPDAPEAAVEALEAVSNDIAALGALAGERRAAHLIGQCAHESMRFSRTAESLFYTTPDRLCAVWPSRFPTPANAQPFCRNPEKLANNVYANRNGNGSPASGDGFKYRGRGYLQLTGRSNYRTFGSRIGVDLENDPDRAEDPEVAWKIAACYLATRKRAGRTAFEWADQDNVEMVTRIVNGGQHGLADRRQRTIMALAGLGGMAVRPQLRRGDDGPAVELLQRALTQRGFALGAIDGDFGPKTETALKAFQLSVGLASDGVAGTNTWKALEPLPA